MLDSWMIRSRISVLNLEQSNEFLGMLNNLHPALKFTCEHEQSNRLSFLDVLVEKTEMGVSTSVYRKPTVTGRYIVYDSYCSTLYKTNLVRNLIMRARRICSTDKLQQELCFLKKVFVQNGYPVQLLSKLFSEPDIQVAEPEFGPDPCVCFYDFHGKVKFRWMWPAP